MKRFLRRWFIQLIALEFTQWVVPAFVFGQGLRTQFTVAFALALFDTFLKPVLKILLLPLNLLTLGAFRWLLNLFALALAVFFLPHFQIAPYTFPGGEWQGFVAPPISFGRWQTLVLLSFVLNLMVVLIRWISRK